MFYRDYSDVNEKPLLDDLSPEKDEGWSGWGEGEDWGESGGQSPAKEKRAHATKNDAWEDWSNEQSPQTKSSDDGWNNDDWGSFNEPTSNKQPANKNNKLKHQKKKAGSSKAKKGEAATGNLIDFGSTNTTTTTTDTKNTQNSGWDNEEVWVQEEDDEWQSLELDMSLNNSKNKVTAKSQKGD